jgi:hypothetical protein
MIDGYVTDTIVQYAHTYPELEVRLRSFSSLGAKRDYKRRKSRQARSLSRSCSEPDKMPPSEEENSKHTPGQQPPGEQSPRQIHPMLPASRIENAADELVKACEFDLKEAIGAVMHAMETLSESRGRPARPPVGSSRNKRDL